MEVKDRKDGYDFEESLFGQHLNKSVLNFALDLVPMVGDGKAAICSSIIFEKLFGSWRNIYFG